VTEQLPVVERHLYGEDYLYDMLAVTMGGRASELVVLGQGSTGAANDLAKATELATKMVREFGLSAALGPVGYPSGGSAFLGDGGSFSTRPFAESTQAEIDTEVSRMLRAAEQKAIGVLTEHRDVLDKLVEHLLDKETVDGVDVYALADRPMPTGGEGMTVAPGRAAATSVHAAATVSPAAETDGTPG
jgi:cell division protease FtsH